MLNLVHDDAHAVVIVSDVIAVGAITFDVDGVKVDAVLLAAVLTQLGVGALTQLQDLLAHLCQQQ